MLPIIRLNVFLNKNSRIYHRLIILHLFCLSSLGVLGQNESPLTIALNKDCRFGVVNKDSEEILPFNYTKIETIPIGNDYLITAKDKTKFSYYLYQNQKLIPLNYPEVEKLNDRTLKVGDIGEYGAINTAGKGILLMNYYHIEPAGTTAMITQNANGYGVVDLDGQPILTNQYEQLNYWTMGGFWAYKNGLYQLFGAEGQTINDAIYDAIKIPKADFSVCGVRKEGKWAVITANNEVVVAFDYQGVQILNAGIIAVQDAAAKWQLMDLKGTKITDQLFDAVKPLADNRHLLVRLGAKKGIINQEGKLILPLNTVDIEYLGNNWVAIKREKEVRIFDLEQQQFLNDSFDAVHGAKRGQDWEGVLVQQARQWKWLAFKMATLSTHSYVNVSPMPSGEILVEGKDRELGVLNSKGTLILPMVYQAISPENGFFKVKKEGTDWFFVNKQNTIINCPLF
ncbi:WG repeat-containing protein [Aureispira anguillae]|uniref:WG repeat-containing protein n=1 Tax=Aureispira anguillae TaxID=2864201 RepID=A0A915YI82_9BACT|nr:WG repeat-containing protein [Aureispira anguillae]BDS13530.1 WG repeat-containing protein [Aureispira anguillae]